MSSTLLDSFALTFVLISTSERLLHRLLVEPRGKIRLCPLSRRWRTYTTFLKADRLRHGYIVI